MKDAYTTLVLIIDNDIVDTWIEGLYVDKAGKKFTSVQPESL